jgi:hypothetical protein
MLKIIHTNKWRTVHNEGLHNLYFSQTIIQNTKSRRMIWLGHKTHGRDKEYDALVRKPEVQNGT